MKYKFLSKDNVDIGVNAYLNAAIIEPYIAIFRLKDYVGTMKALCGGAVKAIITSNTSHDILKMAGKLDAEVIFLWYEENVFRLFGNLGRPRTLLDWILLILE